MSFSGFTDEKVESAIANDGWFPDLTVSDLQTTYRIPAEYENETVVDAIKQAMIWANRQLKGWKAEKVEAGNSALEDVSDEKIGGEAVVVTLYTRAVFCKAKALLTPQFKTMMRRADAKNEGVEAESTEDKFNQMAADAVADILGTGRIIVELL